MARYPGAKWLPVVGLQNDPVILPIGVILHVDGGNSSSLYNYFDGPSGGVESTLFINKEGLLGEQYRDTTREADAQAAGNSWIEGGIRKGYTSVETQGYASGEWTPAQFEWLAKFLAWHHKTHGTPLEPCSGPKDPGIGYHKQFSEWNPNNHACPGPDRIKQIPDLIARANRIVSGAEVVEDSSMRIVDVPGVGYFLIAGAGYTKITNGEDLHRWAAAIGQPEESIKQMSAATLELINNIRFGPSEINSLVDALLTKLPTSVAGSLSKDDVHSAVADVLKSVK